MDTRVESFESLAAQGLLWLVDYESSRWCGGSSHLVVIAQSEDAVHTDSEVESHMEDAMQELFFDEDSEEEEEPDGCAYAINSVEAFGPEHEAWQWFMNPVQRDNFYPVIDTREV